MKRNQEMCCTVRKSFDGTAGVFGYLFLCLNALIFSALLLVSVTGRYTPVGGSFFKVHIWKAELR